MKYYDTILLGILFSMVLGVITGIATSLPANLTVAAGGLVSLALMYHGMFYRAPVVIQEPV